MAKLKSEATPVSGVGTTLQDIEKLFKTELKNAETGCGNCITWFNSIKIPANYQHVLTWLALIGNQEAIAELNKQPVDTVAITTALVLSTQFAANTAANATASVALNAIVSGLVAQYKLDLKNSVNDADLVAYCKKNQIKIPDEIVPFINDVPAPGTKLKL